MYGCGKDCLILIPLRLPQISYFPLNLKCFSSNSDNCLDVGIRPLLQFPYPPRADPVLLTLPFFPPSSLILPSFAWDYIFFSAVQVLLLLSAGVLHVLLCLKAYSWCIRGERCTPCPPSPPPSCSSLLYLLTITSPSSWQSGLGISPLILILPFSLPLINQWPCYLIL